MSKLFHWTPRYVANRLAWGFYQRRNMEKPWLTPAANELLASLLQPTDIGIEWGSGRSTCWFGARIARLTSVEEDQAWYERVKQKIADTGLTNVSYQFATYEAGQEERSAYVRACDQFADGSLGFALVDGGARDFCALAVAPKVATGGLLVVDNINWFLDRPTFSPASRYKKGPANERWAEFERVVSNWRMIWTTSGVTDTAIWIKT